jgi:hypothetical protein
MFIKAAMNDADEQSSDTHWRCANGRGSFNYRMKWDVELPRKFFRLRLQAWDQDITKVRAAHPSFFTALPSMRFCPLLSISWLQYSDCLGETVLDLRRVVKRALQTPDQGVHVFKSLDKYEPPPDDRWWGAKLFEWVWYGFRLACKYLLCCCFKRCRDAKLEFVPPPYRILDPRWWLWSLRAAIAYVLRRPLPDPPGPYEGRKAVEATMVVGKKTKPPSFSPLRFAFGLQVWRGTERV